MVQRKVDLVLAAAEVSESYQSMSRWKGDLGSTSTWYASAPKTQQMHRRLMSRVYWRYRASNEIQGRFTSLRLSALANGLPEDLQPSGKDESRSKSCWYFRVLDSVYFVEFLVRHMDPPTATPSCRSHRLLLRSSWRLFFVTERACLL